MIKMNKLFQLKNQSTPPHRITNFILISASFCFSYLLISLFVFRNPLTPSRTLKEKVAHPTDTSISDVVFGIASNQNTWLKRKDYVKLWWDSRRMRGCVFLDEIPNSTYREDPSLPPICVSEDTSRFRYTYRGGLRSAIRVARVVSETVRLNHYSGRVRWFVFGDDDTVFFTENLVKTLNKYDHRMWYYVGTNSEIVEQNRFFSFDMAFGGAGFAISYPLAKVLSRVIDSCLERYPHLYGSDGRVFSCLAELGVGLTREPGFHQLDVRGDVFGLLAAHPLNSLLSLHHLDYIDPIFPNMTRTEALKHLFRAASIDSGRLMQQTICYDRWFSWTISVSWGYAVQVFPNHVFLPDALRVRETFTSWKKGKLLAKAGMFNTREPHPDACRNPSVFFMESVSSYEGGIWSNYRRKADNCTFDLASPKKLDEIRVFSKKLELDVNQLRAPRRHCCDVLPSSASKVMEVAIRECREDELIYIHS